MISGVAAVALAAAVPAAAIPLPVPDRMGGWGWGHNGSRQLGDRTTKTRTVAVTVFGLTSGVRMMAAGMDHSMALMSDATVRAWGDNTFGQLGNGSDAPYPEPEPVSGLTGVKQITANGTTSLALRSDGTVWAWGANFSGKLGDGTTTHRFVPVQVLAATGGALTDVVHVASGGMHNLAVRSDGTVWAWGANDRGQVGDGTFAERHTAVQVSGLTGVTRVAAGFRHSLALLTDGTVRAWGDDFWGQLGDGALGPPASSRPLPVSGLAGVTEIAAGFNHSLATCGIRCRGALMAWGQNSDGQLGDGTRLVRPAPVPVLNVSSASHLTAGFGHSVARVQVFGSQFLGSWGDNTAGQLGNGTFVDSSTVVEVIGMRTATQAAAGHAHTMAVNEVPPVICCA